MIIRFKNLGSIKETELDLRPLTVILGPNNSNKTYIAYSIYGLWQQLQPKEEYIFPDALKLHESFQIKNDSFVAEQSKIAQSCEEIIQTKSNLFKNNLETFFQDSSRRLFSDSGFQISLSNHFIQSLLSKLSSDHKEFTGNLGRYILTYENEILTIRVETILPQNSDQSNGITMDTWIFPYISKQLHISMFPKPYLLPAERNAFIITYKILAHKRYSLLRDRERMLFAQRDDHKRQLALLREQGDIRYPQPIEDFLELLSEIELEQGHRPKPVSSSDSGRNGKTVGANRFEEIARQVERFIQDGNKTAFKSTAMGGSEIFVNVNKDLQIDLYNASSSIKQLAPLLLYLRYRAAENQLLIIDEPEMNLHPESQVKLLEILAMLVNAGVHVLLTTHSPYFMSHLNNLVQQETVSVATAKRQATSLYLQDPRAFLRMDQVSAYEMRDNQLRSLKDEDYGIRYDTLSDVSEEVQAKRFEIFEKGRAGRRARTPQK